MDQYYYESGYIEASYFTYVADASSSQSITLVLDFSGEIVKVLEVNMSGAFTPSIVITATLNEEIIIGSTASISIDCIKITDTAISFNSSCNLTSQEIRIRDNSVNIIGAFSPIFTVSLLKNAFAVLNSTVDMTATANSTLAGIATLDNIATLNAMAEKTTEFVSILSSSASFSVSIQKVKSLSASLTSTAIVIAKPIEYIKKTYPFNRPAILEEWWTGTGGQIIVEDVTQVFITNEDSFTGSNCVKFTSPFRKVRVRNPAGTIYNLSVNDFCLEFFIKFPVGSSSSYTVSGLTKNLVKFGNVSIVMDQPSNAQLALVGKDTSGTTKFRLKYDIGNPVYGDINLGNTWHRIAITKVGKQLSFYLDSSILTTTLDNNNNNVSFNDSIIDFYAEFAQSPYTTNDYMLLDDISLQIGSANIDPHNYYMNGVLFQPPAGKIYNYYDTSAFYFDFENGYNDNTAVQLTGAAALTSIATLTANAGKGASGSATEPTVSTLTVSANRLRDITANLASNFTADITGMFKPQEAEVSLTSSSALSIDLEIIKQGQFDLPVIASDMIVSVKTTDIIALEAGTFTQTTSADRFRDTPIPMTATAVSDCVPLKIFNLESSQQSAAELSANTQDSLTRDITVDLSSTATLTIGLEIIKQGQVDLPAVAINMIATTRLAGLFIDDQVTATMEIDGDVFLSGVSDMSSTANLSVVETRIFDLAANLNTTTTCDIIPVKTTDSVITANSQATEVVDAVKTVNPPITLSAFGNSSFTIWLTKQGDIELASTSSMSITISLTSGVVVALTATATFTPVITKAVNAQITISSQVTFTASGRLVFIEDYVYIVPKETRLWSIARETRSQYIDRETREYIIGD